MPAKKNNKTEILGDIVRALMDKNTTVQVQTVNTKQTGPSSYVVDGADHIPGPDGKNFGGLYSNNRRDATSIKINDDIQIQLKKNIVKSRDGKYDIDMGDRFIIHTPHGELNVPAHDNGASTLWDAALELYDNKLEGNDDDVAFLMAHGEILDNLHDPELRKIAGGPAVEKDMKSKFERAKAKLASLGITKTKNLDAYLADKIQNDQTK